MMPAPITIDTLWVIRDCGGVPTLVRYSLPEEQTLQPSVRGGGRYGAVAGSGFMPVGPFWGHSPNWPNAQFRVPAPGFDVRMVLPDVGGCGVANHDPEQLAPGVFIGEAEAVQHLSYLLKAGVEAAQQRLTALRRAFKKTEEHRFALIAKQRKESTHVPR